MQGKCSYRRPMNATLCSPVSSPSSRFLIGLAARLVLCSAFALCVSSGVACASPWQGSVGAKLGKRNQDGRVFVREVPPDMAAAHAGLQLDDEILAIDGKPVQPMSADEVHAALAGKVGSFVTLSVRRRAASSPGDWSSAEKEPAATLEVRVERGPLK